MAWMTALVWLTSVAGLVTGFAVGHDASLLASVTASVWAGLHWMAAPGEETFRPRWGWCVATGFFVGLGMLAKGLLGLALPGVAAVAFLLVGWRRPRWPEIVTSGAAALAVAAVWYVPMHLRHPDYLWYFVIERHFLGFLTDGQRHGDRSAWVYLPTLWLAGMPWVPLTLASLRPRPPWRGYAAERGIGLWAAGTLLFFLLAGSKNPGYLLPVLPPLALLAGRSLAGRLSREPDFGGWLRRGVAGLTLVACVTIVVGPLVAASAFATERSAGAILASMVLGAVALGVGVAAWGRPMRRAMVSIPVLVGLTLAGGLWLVFPIVALHRSAAPTVAALLRQPRYAAEGRPILWYDDLPASARLYGGEGRFVQVRYPVLMEPAHAPVELICRETRLREIGPTPMVRGSWHVGATGRYHQFRCGPMPERWANRAADSATR